MKCAMIAQNGILLLLFIVAQQVNGYRWQCYGRRAKNCVDFICAYQQMYEKGTKICVATDPCILKQAGIAKTSNCRGYIYEKMTNLCPSNLRSVERQIGCSSPRDTCAIIFRAQKTCPKMRLTITRHDDRYTTC